MFLILFSCLVGTVVATKPFWHISAFHNSEIPTSQNPTANVEVHCFQLDENYNPIYVRGTFGLRGYFEGPVSNYAATVNWFDVGYQDSPDLYIEAGSGILVYDSSFNNIAGDYDWSGYNSNNTAADFNQPWGIINRCANVHECIQVPYTLSMDDLALQYCFWDIHNQKGFSSSNNIQLYENAIYGAPNPNVWNPLGIGYDQNGLGGVIVGAYRYTYTKQDCQTLNCAVGNVEWGVYGTDTNIAIVNNSIVITTIWHATTGPFTGQDGAGVYAIVAGPNGKHQQIIGFYCSTVLNNPHHPSLGKRLVGCSIDNNILQPNNKANQALAGRLFKTYSKFPSWFATLKSFYQNVFGSHN